MTLAELEGAPADVRRAFGMLAGLVLEDGRRWGEAAAEWQVADALAVLDYARPQRQLFLTRPRGGSKTTDLAGCAAAWLAEIAKPGQRGYVVASDEEQAAELLLAMRGLLTRSRLDSVLTVQRAAVLRSDGAGVHVMAADGASAFGKRPALTIVDELAQWGSTPGPRQVWEAVVSGVLKVPGGRLACLTTAGDPAHWSYRILEQARADPSRWHVSEVPGPLPWHSEADLASQRDLLSEWSFARLHLNQWTSADDQLVSWEVLRRLAVIDTPLQPRVDNVYALGVDLGITNDASVITVAHCEQDGAATRVVVDDMRVWTPSRNRPVPLEAVEAAVAELSSTYLGAPVVFDPAEGRLMMQRLGGQGIPVVPFTFSLASVGQLGSLLHQLLRDELLWLPAGDEALLDELAHVRLRETALGRVRLDHDSGRHDDRAVSIALAANHLLDLGRRVDWDVASHLVSSDPLAMLTDGAGWLTSPAGVRDMEF